MYLIENYSFAVVLCVLTMICWGSWQNTRNLARKQWRFELFYFDFSAGIVFMSLLAALTLGSLGSSARPFIDDLLQANAASLGSAMLGGAIWNLGTLLLTAAIVVAGMSVAFPVGGGIGWLLGILINYIAAPVGNATYLFSGSLVILLAIVLSMLSYRKLAGKTQKPTFKGLFLSFLAGLLIAFFYRFVAMSLISDYSVPEAGKITPYTAVFMFSVGAFISTFLYMIYFMKKPIEGDPLKWSDFASGTFNDHLMGILGGAIWCCGMVMSFMASNAAGFAISYGLGNAAPVVAALWGILVWKEFKNAPAGTNKLLWGMFACYLLGLILIVLSRYA